jgi:hypothetical protein
MFVPPQSKGNRFIGGIKVLAQRVQVYISLGTFLMIASLWYLKIKTMQINILGYTIDLGCLLVSFWVFLGLLLVIFVIIATVDYIYVLPSELQFQLWQQYKHNPIIHDVRELQERVARIEKKLDEILQQLDRSTEEGEGA